MRVSALERLQDLVMDEDSKVALRAVDLILRTSVRFDRLADLDERLQCVEEQLTPALAYHEGVGDDSKS